MKHGLKSILLILLCAFALATNATDEPSILIRQMSAKSVALFMTPNTNQAIEVSILDKAGIQLHKGVLKNKSEISQVYNLDNLPKGDYTLIIDQEFKTYIQPIVINQEEVFVDAKLLTTAHAPAIRHNDQFLDIDIYCNELTEIKYSFISKGEIIFTTNSSKKGVVQKRFNLSELQTGNYEIKLTVKVAGITKTYNKQISI